MNDHKKHIQAHLETISGINTVFHAEWKDRELAPDLAKVFIENEADFVDYFEDGWKSRRLLSNLSEDGHLGRIRILWKTSDGTCIVVTYYDFRNYLRNKDYYNSPLYKALL